MTKTFKQETIAGEMITKFPDQILSIDELISSVGKQIPQPVLVRKRVEVLNTLSQSILRDASLNKLAPWTALAYWLRKSAITRLAADFNRRLPDNVIAAPRGLAVHLPPQNVDTIFVYSWAISFLMGNTNIVRLPGSVGVQTEAAISHLHRALVDAQLDQGNLFIRYKTHSDVNARLFEIADLRFIWGGDAKINTLSVIPAKPGCVTLPFSDRFSFSIIKSQHYAECDSASREALATSMFFDVFQFDQMACSSTRLIFWHGGAEEIVVDLTKDLCDRLANKAKSEGYEIAPQIRMQKFAASNRAVIDFDARLVQDHQTLITSAIVSSSTDVRKEKIGAGFLFFKHAVDTDEIASFVLRKDQTVTHFGFEPSELLQMARRLSVYGVDRLVPAGSALNFDVIWDGFDLMSQSSRMIKVAY